MVIYKSRDELVAILSELWNRILKNPQVTDSLSVVKIMLRFRFKDCGADLYIDNTGEHLAYFWDPAQAPAVDVDMILAADTAHEFWMETLSVPLALASRKVVAKGSVQKALKLLPALKPAFAIYRGVLKDMGRSDLLAAPSTKKKALTGWRRFRLFTSKRGGSFDPSLLPMIHIPLADSLPPEPVQVRENPSPATDEELLNTMRTIRAFEEHLAKEFASGALPTEAVHLSIGQEAVAAGVCRNLRKTDYLNTTHRGHGHIIAKGSDLDRMMAELYGRVEGLCRGLGGSMHVTDGSCGVLGANGIVGAGYLLALGAGFSIKHHHKTDDISVVIAGDGSVNQGMFHEAMNLISILKLPVLVVVENNGYGEFTSLERHSAVTEVHMRARAYNIESYRFDGNDARLVYDEMGKVIARMRADGMPRLVELMTYRWHGHMEGDQQEYRASGEKELHRKADPIARMEASLSARGSDVKKIADAAVSRVTNAAAFAAASHAPGAEVLRDTVYAPEERALFEGSFDIPGARTSLSTSAAINAALAEAMERDSRVFLWGEDVSLGGYFNVTNGLVERFGPTRIIDTPISENAFTGGAVGAAITGMRPVVEILFGDFLTCCMDPIMNQAAKLREMTGGQVSVPMVVRTPVGSGIGMAAQHSQSMERFFFGIPGLIVVAPCDAFTCKGILASAIRSNNPVLFFEHKLLYAESGSIPQGDYTLPLGKARIMRTGQDVTLVTYLLGVSVCMEAAASLEAEGMDVEVIDLVTLYPLDMRMVLASLKKTGRLVVVEEALFTGSVGSEVIAQAALAGHGFMRCAPVKIAAPDFPIPYAKVLENFMMPTPERVVERVRRMMRRR